MQKVQMSDVDWRTISALLDGETFEITRYGQMVGYLVPVENYQRRIDALRLTKQFLDALRLESGIGDRLRDFEKAAFQQADEAISEALEQIAQGEQ